MSYSARCPASSSWLLMDRASQHQQGELVKTVVNFCDATTDHSNQNILFKLSMMHSWHYTALHSLISCPLSFTIYKRDLFFFIYFILLEKTALLLSEVQGGEERILEIELFNLVAPAVLAGSSLTGTQVQQHRQVMKNVALQHFSVNNKAHLFCVSKTLHAAHISNSVNLKIIQKSKSLFNQQDIPD